MIQQLEQISVAIVSLGLLATLVVNGANTANVIAAATKGFASSVSAAEKG